MQAEAFTGFCALLMLIAFVCAFGLYLGRDAERADDAAQHPAVKAQEISAELPVCPYGPQLTPVRLKCSRAGIFHDDGQLTAETLKKALGPDLAPLAADFVEAGTDNGVCPLFLASVCALESGWGTSDIARQQNNLAGLTRGGEYLAFDSPADSIYYLATLLRDDYAAGGKYYSGDTSVDGISVHYNPEHAGEWAERVRGIMEDMEDKTNG